MPVLGMFVAQPFPSKLLAANVTLSALIDFHRSCNLDRYAIEVSLFATWLWPSLMLHGESGLDHIMR